MDFSDPNSIIDSDPTPSGNKSESITSFLWKYKLFIGLGLIIVLVIVMIIIFLPKSKPKDIKCPTGKIKNPCGGDDCVTQCPNHKIQKCDDKKFTCVCSDIEKTCGDNCCLSNQSCDTTTNTCKTNCGKQMCDDNEICEVVHNVSDQTFQSISSKYKKYDRENNDVYVCIEKPKTYFSTQKELPVQIDNILPCYQIGDGFCTSKETGDKQQKNICFKYNKSTCNTDPKCNWMDTLSQANNDLENLKKEYTIASLNSPYGYYCKPDDNTYNRIISSNSNGTYEDCLQYMGNPNTQHVYWDDNKKTCTSLQECNVDFPNCPVNIPNSSYIFKDGQIYNK
jgi:hypothetical protein